MVGIYLEIFWFVKCYFFLILKFLNKDYIEVWVGRSVFVLNFDFLIW